MVTATLIFEGEVSQPEVAIARVKLGNFPAIMFVLGNFLKLFGYVHQSSGTDGNSFGIAIAIALLVSMRGQHPYCGDRGLNNACR